MTEYLLMLVGCLLVNNYVMCQFLGICPFLGVSKKFDTALSADAANAGAVLTSTVSAIDRAVAKGVLHKNAANRKKARLAKRLNKAAAAV